MSKVETLTERELAETALAIEVLLGFSEILRVIVAAGPDILVALAMNPKQIETGIADCRRKTTRICQMTELK